jgi:hypothetical protein
MFVDNLISTKGEPQILSPAPFPEAWIWDVQK